MAEIEAEEVQKKVEQQKPIPQAQASPDAAAVPDAVASAASVPDAAQSFTNTSGVDEWVLKSGGEETRLDMHDKEYWSDEDIRTYQRSHRKW